MQSNNRTIELANGLRRGFTIVELLMVLGIIAVLMGIITTAASSSIRASRTQKASALCTLVQTGLATYREQKGEWPVPVLNNETISPRSNNEGPGGKSDDNKIVLTANEVHDAVRQLIYRASREKSPVMDISGLFVAEKDNQLTGASNKRHPEKAVHGMDFMSAIRGTKKSRKKLSTAKMYFGYPDPETGYFLRFRMVYSIASDQITVEQQK